MEERTLYTQERQRNDACYPEMLSPREVAARTGLSYYYLRNACLKGEIPYIRAGRSIKINYTRFAEMLNSVQQGDADESIRVS